jgi:membrane-bound metal-dependent hydrolase YbcI (DUF457 family)
VPFTPYHFGPGLLFKAVVPRHFSFLAFATTQVAIDLESWYYLTRSDPHVHRVLHTFVFGSVMGLAIGALVWFLGFGIHALLGRRVAGLSIGAPLPVFQPELSVRGAALGGLLGGFTHTLFDSFMHGDINPLRPFSVENPLLDVVAFDVLQTGCIVAGIVGALGVLGNLRVWRATGPTTDSSS